MLLLWQDGAYLWIAESDVQAGVGTAECGLDGDPVVRIADKSFNKTLGCGDGRQARRRSANGFQCRPLDGAGLGSDLEDRGGRNIPGRRGAACLCRAASCGLVLGPRSGRATLINGHCEGLQKRALNSPDSSSSAVAAITGASGRASLKKTDLIPA
jgi:hypothetical protein